MEESRVWLLETVLLAGLVLALPLSLCSSVFSPVKSRCGRAYFTHSRGIVCVVMQKALSTGEAHQDWLKFSRNQAMRGPESCSFGSGQGLERVGKLLEGFKQENDRAGFALERLT